MNSEYNDKSLNQIFSKKISRKEIEDLYLLVNLDRDWKIDIGSPVLVDRIIELWFERNGYDFWENPFPEVVEWKLNTDGEIEFIYVLN